MSSTVVWASWQEASQPHRNILDKIMRSDYWRKAGRTILEPWDKIGSACQQLASGGVVASSGDLSYDSMITGFMAAKEETKAEPLRTLKFDFYDVPLTVPLTPIVTRTKGRAVVTNKRLLLLSCEPGYAAHASYTNKPWKGSGKGSVDLRYDAKMSVWYRPVPLANLKSIEMLIETGTVAEGAVLKKTPETCGCMDCFCCCCCPTWCDNYYVGQDVMSRSTNDRYVELHYEGEAWKEKRAVRIHIEPDVPLVEVQSWLADLQANAPNLAGKEQTSE